MRRIIPRSSDMDMGTSKATRQKSPRSILLDSQFFMKGRLEAPQRRGGFLHSDENRRSS
jgi:hypothetical protein